MWTCTLPPGHDGPCKPGRGPGLRLILYIIFGRDFWLKRKTGEAHDTDHMA